jgi:hypothetical protein
MPSSNRTQGRWGKGGVTKFEKKRGKSGGQESSVEAGSGASTTRGQMCGVLEFSAAAGCCYVPSWIMEQNKLQPGDMVRVR